MASSAMLHVSLEERENSFNSVLFREDNICSLQNKLNKTAPEKEENSRRSGPNEHLGRAVLDLTGA